MLEPLYETISSEVLCYIGDLIPKLKTYVYDESLALSYFNDDKTYKEIADIVGASANVILKLYQQHYTKLELRKRAKKAWSKVKLGELNPMSGKVGNAHPNYKGVISDNKGYELILKPSWYTGRINSKHIFYHHYIYCLINNITEIPLGYHIHHIDENKLNNNITNLLLLSASDHLKLHWNSKRSETSALHVESSDSKQEVAIS